MATTTTTTAAELIPVIISAAEHTRQAGEVLKPLIRIYDISGKDGNTKQIPIMAAAGTAGDTTEGSDYVTITTLDSGSGPSNITVKIIKHIFKITDLAVLSTGELVAMVGLMLGQAMARKIDYDLQQLFSGLSQTVAGAGTSLALAHFDSAMQQLKQAYAPGPYNAVLSTKQIWGAKGISAIFPVNANYRSFSPVHPESPAGELARNGFSGKILGFDIFCDAIIATDGNDDDQGAFFSRDALALVMKDTTMKYETDRDGSAGDTEHIGSMAIKAGEKRDVDGVSCLSDVS